MSGVFLDLNLGLGSWTICTVLSYLMIDNQVEDCQASKGHNVHDYKIEPSDIKGDVVGILSQVCGNDVGNVRI